MVHLPAVPVRYSAASPSVLAVAGHAVALLHSRPARSVSTPRSRLDHASFAIRSRSSSFAPVPRCRRNRHDPTVHVGSGRDSPEHWCDIPTRLSPHKMNPYQTNHQLRLESLTRFRKFRTTSCFPQRSRRSATRLLRAVPRFPRTCQRRSAQEWIVTTQNGVGGWDRGKRAPSHTLG